MTEYRVSDEPDDRQDALRRLAQAAQAAQATEAASAPALGTVSRPELAERIPVSFSGRGGEYFRIWIVNLLLMLVTLGLYYPWAKVRKLRYFYTHTQVGGHALDFHGNPRKMLRGTLLMALLFGLYSVAGEVSPLAGLAALGIIGAIWPALYRASLQFRLSNTSWRGLRFAFTGSMKDSYLAFGVPLFALVLVGVAASLWVGAAGAGTLGRRGAPALLGVMAIAMLSTFALTAILWFRIKRYLHAHLAFGRLGSEFRATQGQFFGVFIRTTVVALLGLMVAAALFGVALAAKGPMPMPSRNPFPLLLSLLPVLFLTLLAVQFLPRAYFTSRMQNLLWSRTGNRYLRFKSELRMAQVLGLMLKNTVLVVLTLGLYWPWAAVALARMKLHAMVLITRVDLDRIAAAASRSQAGDAAGDAAADLFGVDFGI